MELVGEFPRHVALSGRYAREYFDSLGELRHIRRIKYWKLKDVLREKYNLSVTDAADVADFILPMIAVDRRRRFAIFFFVCISMN
jgi:serine/threonine-protein kinase SRPK3